MDIRIVVPGMPIATPDPFAVSLGGSETAGLQLGRAFARKGHRVTVFCVAQRSVRWQGVMLVPLKGYVETPAARAGDLLLIQRAPSALQLAHTAKAAFLWMHDLPTPTVVPMVMAAMLAVDRLVTVSEWQAQQFRELAPDLTGEQILVARNGIDLDLIAAGVRDAVARDPYRIVYSSRPERGLEVLLGEVFPRILAEEPRATLHLATYDNAQPEAEPYYRHLREMAERFGDRVVQHSALAKRDLYSLLATSGVAVYPTPAPSCPEFAETSCITAMEAMACGLPWVSTDQGALPETVGDAGVLVPLNGVPHAAEGDTPQRLAAAALWVMRDPEHTERLRAAGLERAAGLGWSGVADQLAAVASQIVAAAQPKLRAVRSLKPTADPEPSPAQAPLRAASRDSPPPVLLIATPVYGGVHPCFAQSLLATQALLPQYGVKVQWIFLAGDSLLSRARNSLASVCLANAAATHILWIDSDISWQPEAVLRLLRFDVDFVCALYPRKAANPTPVGRFVFMPLETGTDVAPFDPYTGLLEIAAAGAGFMLTKRVVYERMVEAYPESRLTSAPEMEAPPGLMAWLYNFFPVVVEDGLLLSEGYAFCHRWRALGGRIWADPAIQLTHYGAHSYTGDPMSMFGPVLEAAA